MGRWEYKVVPAPRQAAKQRGRMSGAERFALTIAGAINGAAAEGWEFVRAERLVCEAKRGFWRRGGGEAEHDLLVFRREAEAAAPAQAAARGEAQAAARAEGGLRLAPAAERVEAGSRPAPVGPATREAPDRIAPLPPLKP